MRVQDFYPESFHQCFGCGSRNPDGLQLSTVIEDQEVVSRWTPDPRFRGAATALHGGIVALLMDEVAGAAAFAGYHRNQGAELGALRDFDFVTATLTVDYLEPAPMDRELTIRARVTEAEGRKIWTTCDIWLGDIQLAKGRLLFVSVNAERG